MNNIHEIFINVSFIYSRRLEISINELYEAGVLKEKGRIFITILFWIIKRCIQFWKDFIHLIFVSGR